MILTGAEIRRRGIIRNAVQSGYRACSYDLRVGRIIGYAPDGKSYEDVPSPKQPTGLVGHIFKREATPGSARDSYILNPQGIVEVLSAETVNVPQDVAGYAMVKTSLSSRGVLALNIGIIDPGYSGALSTTLLNFSRDPFVVRPDTIFLRLTFHDCELTREPPPTPTTVASIIDKLTYYAPTFLNIEELSAEFVKRLFWRYFALGASMFTLLLGAFTVLIGASNFLTVRLTKDLISATVREQLEAKTATAPAQPTVTVTPNNSAVRHLQPHRSPSP